MITDIHRHFVPPEFFDFVKARPEYSVTVKREEDANIDLDIRGMHFGLNKTFFELDRQIGRMRGEGVERAILSLATPFINYYLDAEVAVKSARRFNDSLASSIAGQPTDLVRGRFCRCRIQLPLRMSSNGVCVNLASLVGISRRMCGASICMMSGLARFADAPVI